MIDMQINGFTPYIHDQLIFNKGAEIIQWGKQSFEQMLLGHLNIHMQKTEGEPPLLTSPQHK
jgi:hypothetical protein